VERAQASAVVRSAFCASVSTNRTRACDNTGVSILLIGSRGAGGSAGLVA
jgi:hypothetical protein